MKLVPVSPTGRQVVLLKRAGGEETDILTLSFGGFSLQTEEHVTQGMAFPPQGSPYSAWKVKWFDNL